MNSKDFMSDVVKVESGDFKAISERLNGKHLIRLLHAGIGLNTEAGELIDGIKKHIFYGKTLDETNLKEELGDLFWYAGVLCDEMGWTFEEIMTLNTAKLKARYGDKFSADKAINRDLNKELSVLNNE